VNYESRQIKFLSKRENFEKKCKDFEGRQKEIIDYKHTCARALSAKREIVLKKRKDLLHSKDVRGNQSYREMLSERSQRRAASLESILRPRTAPHPHLSLMKSQMSTNSTKERDTRMLQTQYYNEARSQLDVIEE
jgi:hypothetical protein